MDNLIMLLQLPGRIFRGNFRSYHIPEGLIELKAEERGILEFEARIPVCG